MDRIITKTKKIFISLFIAQAIFSAPLLHGLESGIDPIVYIQQNRGNDQELAKLLPIVKCSFTPTKYEQILMTILRDAKTNSIRFRKATNKLGALLINKVVDCLPAVAEVDVQTPVASCKGLAFTHAIELVSIMRSGDALVDTFISHFPDANVSKVLIQRDEETALPNFIYMKLSPTLANGGPIVITEPMIASGGTLDMLISLLKDKGIAEDNIIIASICTAPEGLLILSKKYPGIRVVMIAMDDQLNAKKYIVPGLGDFGDRYFGTVKHK